MLIVVSMTIFFLPHEVKAQIPLAEVIKAGVKKIVKAVDLKVQRLQNKTIWLQNAQKVLENKLSKLRLGEISDWSEKQRNLYKDYFEELKKVKTAITYYHRIKDIGLKQSKILKAYQQAWDLTKKDPNFTPKELMYISNVYSGILDASLKNLDGVMLVITAFQTQMSDAERLEIIRDAADQIDTNYFDLMRFNRENIQLSISRAKGSSEINQIRQWYGLNN
ncbi:conjugal transfer protein TraI [Pedobacter psychrophilus]|nr:conjugal transfer protein TraI [Pedobacter psychrophilus]